MKIAGLTIGIGMTILSFISLVIFLLMPSMTNNRVNPKEAMIGIIPSVLFIFIGLLITAVASIILIKGKSKGEEQ